MLLLLDPPGLDLRGLRRPPASGRDRPRATPWHTSTAVFATGGRRGQGQEPLTRSVESALAPAQAASAPGPSLGGPAIAERGLAAEIGGRRGNVGSRSARPGTLRRRAHRRTDAVLRGHLPPGRGGRFSASLTRSGRPFRSRPFMDAMHFCAVSSSSNSTKAKPRGRPVSRSVGSFASTTRPTSLNASMSSSRVTSKLRLPTKTLFEMSALSLRAAAPCGLPTSLTESRTLATGAGRYAPGRRYVRIQGDSIIPAFRRCRW